MKKAIFMMTLMVLTPISVMAGIVAQQYQDFQPFYNGHPDTDGTGTWRYMYSDNFNPADPESTTGDLIGYIYNETVGYYVDPPSDIYPDIQIVDGRVTMIGQEGPICPEQYCVIRWTSGVMGLVNVTGIWTHYHNVLNDGMDVAVFVDGVEMFWTIFSSGSVSFDFDIPISIGSTVDFVVGNNPPLTWGNDRAYIETTITLLLTPYEMVGVILDFFDESIADGTLVPVHPGTDEVDTLRDWILNAKTSIEKDKLKQAEKALQKALERTDGLDEPKEEWVEGPAAPELAAMIQNLIECL